MKDFTTLCYLERDGKYLMLHRIKKENDLNKDKWIGIGGHFEKGESPEDCVLREVKEETGLTLEQYRFCGIITFLSDMGLDSEATEYMCLFHSEEFSGNLIDCDEGTLEWISKKDLLNLELWEGDKIFLRLMDERRAFFSLKLEYMDGKLVDAVLDGKKMQENDNKFQNQIF